MKLSSARWDVFIYSAAQVKFERKKNKKWELEEKKKTVDLNNSDAVTARDLFIFYSTKEKIKIVSTRATFKSLSALKLDCIFLFRAVPKTKISNHEHLITQLRIFPQDQIICSWFTVRWNFFVRFFFVECPYENIQFQERYYFIYVKKLNWLNIGGEQRSFDCVS